MPKAFLIRKSISAKELYLSFQWRPVSPPPSPDEDDDKDQPLNLSTDRPSSQSLQVSTSCSLVSQRVPVIQSTAKVPAPVHLTQEHLSYAPTPWLSSPRGHDPFSPPKHQVSPTQSLLPVQQPLSLQIDSQSNHSYDSSSSSSSSTGLKSGQTSPAAAVAPTVQILASRLGEISFLSYLMSCYCSQIPPFLILRERGISAAMRVQQ